MSSNYTVKLDTQGKPVLTFIGKEKITGTRTCPQCGISEAETLKKNDRYTFVSIIVQATETAKKNNPNAIGTKQMGCVYCYNKNRSKSSGAKEVTLDKVRENIAYWQGIEKIMLDATSQAKAQLQVKVVPQAQHTQATAKK